MKYLTRKEIVEIKNKQYALICEYSGMERFGQEILDFEESYYSDHIMLNFEAESNKRIFLRDISAFFFHLDTPSYHSKKDSPFGNPVSKFIQFFLDAAHKRVNSAGQTFLGNITVDEIEKMICKLDIDHAKMLFNNAVKVYEDRYN